MAEFDDESEKLYKRSGKYGWIHPDSKHFDDVEFLGEDQFINYKIIKVKVWTGKKDNRVIVNGIQVFYKSLLDGKIITPGEQKGENGLEKSDEFEVNANEYLSDFHIKIDNEVTNIGFTTSKNRVFKYGGDTGEDKITPLKEKDKIITFLFGCYGGELQSCGVGYVEKKDFMKSLFSGYFELKFLLKKKEEFKKATTENVKNLKESDYALYKTCTLPDACFNQIIKFCLI